MCLNHDANLNDCSNHPNATSPLLAKYFYDNLLETEVLERYLTMITSLLNSCPGKYNLAILWGKSMKKICKSHFTKRLAVQHFKIATSFP